MSAWYVLAAAGIHPVCPGNLRYEITSPVFEKVEIRLDPMIASGERFIIETRLTMLLRTFTFKVLLSMESPMINAT